jgi:hypothetical protein
MLRNGNETKEAWRSRIESERSKKDRRKKEVSSISEEEKVALKQATMAHLKSRGWISEG